MVVKNLNVLVSLLPPSISRDAGSTAFFHICPILRFYLNISLQLSWQSFLEVICHCHFPRDEREWLSQGHPAGFVSKVRLQLAVFQFLSWCLHHCTKLSINPTVTYSFIIKALSSQLCYRISRTLFKQATPICFHHIYPCQGHLPLKNAWQSLCIVAQNSLSKFKSKSYTTNITQSCARK